MSKNFIKLAVFGLILRSLSSCEGKLEVLSPTAKIKKLASSEDVKVLKVSSDKNSGTYGINTVVTIYIQFSEAVEVDGSATLALSGMGDAVYSSGSGSDTLTFTYIVKSGDSATKLDYATIASLVGKFKSKNDKEKKVKSDLPAKDSATSLASTSGSVVIKAKMAEPTIATTTPVITYNNVGLIWTASTDSDVQGYIIARSSSPITWTPTGGTTYAQNDTPTSGVSIVYKGATTSYNDTATGLKYYAIFAYDSLKNYATPITGSGTGYLWKQEAYMRQPALTNFAALGRQLAMSGDTIAASSESGNGKVEVYRLVSGVWTWEATLTAPNGAAGDSFGASSGNYNGVAINGDIIVVGAPYEDSNDVGVTNGVYGSTDNSIANEGAAYIFKRSGSTWTQVAFLKAPVHPTNNSLFGRSVAVYGDTVVVGATDESSNQTTITNGPGGSMDFSMWRAGAVFVFRETAGVWAQEAYLKVPNSDGDDFLGYSVDIYGDTIVAGAIGEASNDTAVINGGGTSTNDAAAWKGAAYVFKRTGTTWALESFLKASNGGGECGRAVKIYADTIAMACSSESSTSTTVLNDGTASGVVSGNQVGAVFLYTRTGVNWAQTGYLKPSKSEASHMWFGYASLAMYDNIIAVGALQEDSCGQTNINGSTGLPADTACASAGAVFVYRRTGTTWAHDAYLKAVNTAGANFNFGFGVGVNANHVVASSLGDGNTVATVVQTGQTISDTPSGLGYGALTVFTSE